ncbi:MAG: c-type cytochrome biogenesis protein CcmI [Hyphomicrobiaceae bacterium]|nr:c-type cytochrome biogenesis protein CcmI [Hyphomicrobiaceae bacterium]
MLLWIGFSLLTIVVIAALARPLLGGGKEAPTSHSADLAVYRDQLEAIEAEKDQGILGHAEAEAARAELVRRLLRAADGIADQSAKDQNPADAKSSESPSTPANIAVYAAAVLIPLLSIGVYISVGSPDLPGNPFAERMAHGRPGKSIDELIGMVEARLKEKPDDGKGWEVIAPVYMKQQRFEDGARAYANAIRFLGETPERISGFAEAIVLANNGLIVPDARKAYHRLLQLHPGQPEARFWLAVAKEQDSDIKGAIADLEGLLKDAPAEASWRPLVETKLSELRKSLEGGPDAGGGAPLAQSKPTAPQGASDGPGFQPSKEGVATVLQMSPEEQRAFMSQRIDGLAARLEKDSKDLEGWKRLVRAYKVMGRDADAAGAMAKARSIFVGDRAATEALDSLAKDLGVGS